VGEVKVATNALKVEQVHSPKSLQLSVDLFMRRDSGIFFADVGGERVEEETKERAVKRIKELLEKVADVAWREVILLRIDKPRDPEDGHLTSRENDKTVYSAGCSFTYFRRERAPNPLIKGRTVEREHPIEFEQRIARERKRIHDYTHVSVAKKRADEKEKQLREERATLFRVDSPWDVGRQGDVEVEMAYTPEAWAGVERIARTLSDMQAQLDAFAVQATPNKLAALASGEVFRQLPAAPTTPTKGSKTYRG
jgi:hypothetical protein